MMRMFLVTLMTTGLAATSLAAAEVPATMDVRMVAEHQQWAADHEKWHAEHLALAKRLEALAARLRRCRDGASSELSVTFCLLCRCTEPALLISTRLDE
ncbi:MAG: hypothetical protein ACOYKQ_06080 [Polymorphobacter sp.]